MPDPNPAADRKPIVCPICQKRFASKQSIKTHKLLVHENAGRFKCGHCDKTFQYEIHLKSHENAYTGEKPFKCKKCSKGFNTNGHLKVHELNNHAEKKLKCPHPQCDMAFGRKDSLNRHLVTHSTERPFQCDKCPKRFASKDLLKSHQVYLHQEKKFKCDPCGMSFARKDRLRKHLQGRMHREDREEVDEQPDERSKPTNYRAGPDLEKSDESESNTESGGEEAEQPERHAERRKIKTENCLPDEQGSEPDDSMEGSLKRIKIEPEEFELAPLEPTDFEAYDFMELAAANMKRMKRESQANSGQADQKDELVPESSTWASANLKLDFD